MILELSYEEVTALNSAAERIRGGAGGGVAAPPEAIAALDERLPLRGDIAVESPAEQKRLLSALDAVLAHLKQRMDALILEQYVGADDPVNAYFDYANVLTIRQRLHRIGLRMRAVNEVIEDSSDRADTSDTSNHPIGSAITKPPGERRSGRPSPNAKRRSRRAVRPSTNSEASGEGWAVRSSRRWTGKRTSVARSFRST